MGTISSGGFVSVRGDFTLSVEALSVAEGEKIALLGENGCGKTTLLHTLAGLLPVTGEIFCGRERWNAFTPRKRAAYMSYLPQDTSVLFNLTVGELLDLALADQPSLRGEERRAALAATEMEHCMDRVFHSLSGGEKRRAMLARVLCRGSPFILLDEPTASLDMRHCSLFMRHVAGSSAAVIAAMHDVNLALRFFERFLLMKNGRILFDKRKDELDAAEL